MATDNIHDIILKQLPQPLWDCWYVRELIGIGASSRVYRIEAKREHRTDVSALKIVPIMPDENISDKAERAADLEKKRKLAVNETSIMYKLRKEPYIILYEDEQIRPVRSGNNIIGYCLLIRMELLTGVQDMISSGSFDASEKNVLRLACDIAGGISSAHAVNVIHRDIKPANFFVSDSGRFLLGDFDISKRAITSCSFAGTEGYIAPEVRRIRSGETAEYTDKADIYSFGISLYYLMNDMHLPFPENSPSDIISAPPVNASPEFAAIILKACAFSPDDRYSTINEMLSDLRKLSGSSETAMSESVHKYSAKALAAAVMLTAVVTFLLTWLLT